MTNERGQQLATDLKCPFLEASAKTRTNVVESFEALVREIKMARGAGNDKPEAAGTEPEKKVKRRGGCSLL